MAEEKEIRDRGAPVADDSLRAQLQRECGAMARYALASGEQVPPGLVTAIEGRGAAAEVSTRQLAWIHGRLASIIAPATPRTILLMAEEQRSQGIWGFLGPVPLVRGLMFSAVVFLAALLGVSLSPHVDGQVNWSQEDGLKLLLEELFLISAAGLGATFSALFQVNRYITDGTYDPKYNTTYWTRIVLGVVAGMILAMLIPIDVGEGGSLSELTKPTLAMLGGFSVTVVYGILHRLIGAVESLVRGDVKEVMKARMKMADLRAHEEIQRNRMDLAVSLTQLQKDLASGQDSGAAHDTLARLIDELTHAEFAQGEAAGDGGGDARQRG